MARGNPASNSFKEQAMSDFFATLETDALNVWQTIKTDVAGIVANVEPAIAADLKTVMSQLMPVALNLVTGFAAAAFNQWTGGQKASAVDAALVATAKAQGLSLLSRDAGMVRQIAYRAVGMAAPTTGG
jgi:DNA-binding phage protein